MAKTLTVNETLSLLDTVQYCYDVGLSFFFWQDNGNCFFSEYEEMRKSAAGKLTHIFNQTKH